VFVLDQAAILAGTLGRHLKDLQHRELVDRDGAHQLPVLQPGERGGGATLGAAVERQRGTFQNRQGVVDHGLPGTDCVTRVTEHEHVRVSA